MAETHSEDLKGSPKNESKTKIWQPIDLKDNGIHDHTIRSNESIQLSTSCTSGSETSKISSPSAPSVSFNPQFITQNYSHLLNSTAMPQFIQQQNDAWRQAFATMLQRTAAVAAAHQMQQQQLQRQRSYKQQQQQQTANQKGAWSKSVYATPARLAMTSTKPSIAPMHVRGANTIMSMAPRGGNQLVTPTSTLGGTSTSTVRFSALTAHNCCAECGALFRLTSDLVHHMRTQHRKNGQNEQQQQQQRKRHVDRTVEWQTADVGCKKLASAHQQQSSLNVFGQTTQSSQFAKSMSEEEIQRLKQMQQQHAKMFAGNWYQSR